MPAKTSTKANTKTSRCWPGYEPVPGKREHEGGKLPEKTRKPQWWQASFTGKIQKETDSAGRGARKAG